MDPEEGLRLLVAEYDRTAAVYDARVVPHYRPLAEDLLAITEVGPGDSLLDVGCGTGNLVFQAAPRVGALGRVVGIDLATGMVRLAHQKTQPRNHPQTAFLRMDARQLAFRDRTFTVVASCLGIPGLGHAHAFREAHRVLENGGRFAFCVATGKGTALPFRRLLEEYRSPDPPPEVVRLLEARHSIDETKEPATLRNPDRGQQVLRSCGFRETAVTTRVHRRVYPTPEAYVASATAWGDNERELTAMDPTTRRRFLRAFHEAVTPLLTEEGVVVEIEHHHYWARK